MAPPTAALVLIGLALCLLVFSMLNAYSPSVVKVRLTSSKLTARVRFVQITDVHIGSRSSAFLDRVIPSQVERGVTTLDLDLRRYILLMYHRPRGLTAAAAPGCTFHRAPAPAVLSCAWAVGER